MGNVFSIPTFFVLFRETIEAALIISVLLSFCHQMFADDQIMLKRLTKQIWMGTGLGLLIVLAVGAGIIGSWYALSENLWEKHELLYEGSLAIIACFIITVVGITMLKSSRKGHQEKWRRKLMKEMARHNQNVQDEDSEAVEGATDSQSQLTPKSSDPPKNKFLAKLTSEKYALFFIPFITILREGIEAVIFVGGVGLTEPAKSLPLAAITGLILGFLLGYITYKTGSRFSLQWFFVASTCLLFLIASGLLARGILSFETHYWLNSLLYPAGGGDEGAPILVNLQNAIWYLDCCGAKEKGWSIFNAIAGWSNIATKGSISGYCLYWIAVSAWLVGIKTKEQREVKHAHVEEIKVGSTDSKSQPTRLEG